MGELSARKNALKEKVENQELESIALTLQISETEKLFTKLKSENLNLMSKLEKVNDFDGKGKKDVSRLQIEFEEKLRDSQKHLTALHKNEELERDLVRMRKNLTNSSQILSNLTSQGVNNGKGLGYQYKIHSLGSQGKVVHDGRNKIHKPLYTHYEEINTLKENYQSWHKAKMSSARYIQNENSYPKSFIPFKNVKKNSLPRWAKKDLIIPLFFFWELKLKWFPNLENDYSCRWEEENAVRTGS